MVRWIEKIRDEGRDYVVEILEELDCANDLWEVERFYIALYRCLGYPLMNLADGGPGSSGCRWKLSPEARASRAALRKPVTDETRIKMSLAHKGKRPPREVMEKLWAGNRGKKRGPRPPEVVEKLRAANLGKKQPAEQVMAKSRAVVDGEGVIYGSVREAARLTGISRTAIRNVLGGLWRHARGKTFYWYLPEPNAR